MLYSEIYKAFRLREKTEDNTPYWTTFGERSYLAQMLSMPEAEAFLNREELRRLVKCYGQKPECSVKTVGAEQVSEAWQSNIYLDKVRFIIGKTEGVAEIEKKGSAYEQCMEKCFHFKCHGLSLNESPQIAFPIGINVDMDTRSWYLDYYLIDVDDNSNVLRKHTKIDEFEELLSLDNGEKEKLRAWMDRCNARFDIEEAVNGLEYIERIHDASQGTISDKERRPYKLYIYVKNEKSAAERAAATFTRYKRKISIERTDVFSGRQEKVFCFHIYYYEWERKELLKQIIGLGKYACVKRLNRDDYEEIIRKKTHGMTAGDKEKYMKEMNKEIDFEIKECEMFIADLLRIIEREKEICSFAHF